MRIVDVIPNDTDMASAPAAAASKPRTSLPNGPGIDIESFIVNDVPGNANDGRFDVEAFSAVHDEVFARLAAPAIGARGMGGGMLRTIAVVCTARFDTEVQPMWIGN